ncbi:MAG: O-antigen ligase family protein [Anaerolineae bacterium]
MSQTRRRRVFFLREIAIFLPLTYFTVLGGTIAGTLTFALLLISQVLALIVLMGWALRKAREGRTLPRTPLDLPLLLFLLANVVSTAFSIDRRLSLETLSYLLAFVLIYYLLTDLLLERWATETFTRALMMSSIILIIVALLDVSTKYLSLSSISRDLKGDIAAPAILLIGRGERFAIHVNILGRYMAMLLPLSLCWMPKVRSWPARIGLLIWMGSAAAVIISTVSRGALVGLAGGLLTLGVLVTLPKWRLIMSPGARFQGSRWMITILGLVLMAILLVGAGLGFQWLVRIAPGSIGSRLQIWRNALETMRQRPLLGGGPGTFGISYYTTPHHSPLRLSVPHAHNSLLNLGVEIGILGLLAGASLVGTAAFASWRRASRRDNERLTAAGAASGVAALLLSDILDVSWVAPLITIHVALFMAIVVSTLCRPGRTVTKRLAIFPLIATLTLAGFWAWIDVGHYFAARSIEAIRQGDFPSALRSIDHAVSLDPAFTLYRLQRGGIEGYLATEGERPTAIEKAMADYEAHMAHGGDTALNNSDLAWLYAEENQLKPAISHMRRALSLAPRNSTYHLHLGYLLEAQGNLDDAGVEYATALALNPAHIESGFWQASAFRRSTTPHLLRQAAQLTPTLAPEQVALSRAQLAYYGHDLATATRILADLDGPPLAHLLMGRIAEEQGDYLSALAHIERALEGNRIFPRAYLELGRIYYQLGEEDQAKAALRIAIALGLREAEAFRGEIAYQEGDISTAIEGYEAGLTPSCKLSPSQYLGASLGYHRIVWRPDFRPEVIKCAPRNELMLLYLHWADAYRRTGEEKKGQEICDWLSRFYGISLLKETDGYPEACP